MVRVEARSSTGEVNEWNAGRYEEGDDVRSTIGGTYHFPLACKDCESCGRFPLTVSKAVRSTVVSIGGITWEQSRA